MNSFKVVSLPVVREDESVWDMAFPLDSIQLICPYYDDLNQNPDSRLSYVMFYPNSVRMPKINNNDESGYIMQAVIALSVNEAVDKINGLGA